ncbi:MAG: ferritin family protein [Methanospirillum sp.]|nr:ferritin family protein [Methanospirillum sp.]
MTPEEYRKIIEDAINNEVEAYTFYQTLSEKIKDENLKKLFGELAGEEKGHREYLQKLLTKDIKSLGFSSTKDYKVGDSLPTPALTPDLSPVDGLVVAIKKELAAMQMYTQLAAASDDAEVKKLFTDLATMERGHKTRLEDLYVNAAFTESW